MELRQLEAFVQVVLQGSFSGAAKTLYLTQPTVSTHIATLEQELGTKLILRTTKEVSLSDAGRIFYDYARDILAMRSNAIEALSIYTSKVEGNLRIAASTIPRQYFLPELMATFRKQYPAVSFSVMQGDSAQVYEMLQNQTAELGLTGSAPENSRYDYRPFYQDQLVVVTPYSDYFRTLGSTGISPKMLATLPLIVREEGSGTRKETEAYLRGFGILPTQLNVVAQLDDIESIKQSISQGIGVSVMSMRAVQDFCDFKKVLAFPLGETPLFRNLFLATNTNRPISQVAKTFSEFILQYYS